jgi:hypothetical protein
MDKDKQNQIQPLVPVKMTGLEEIAESLLKPVPENISGVSTPANINPREYIQIGINGLHGNPVAISVYEAAESNNKNYEQTHRFALEKGLYIPTPRIFMTHFKNVIEAKKGNKFLKYADGTQVPNQDIEELYKHLTTNYKDVFGANQPGAWTWLNAGFKNGNIQTVIGLNQDKTLKIHSEKLESCLDKDCFAELSFNSQGLAVREAANQEYIQGENIKFWYPRDNCVARFYAGSDWAYLYCDRDPDFADPGLGVFLCAEGAGAR